MQKIDWAIVTSANLSTQAWGSAASATGDVRICSYEIGVVVWPALWDDAATTTATNTAVNTHNDDGAEKSTAIMIPVFGRDFPPSSSEDSAIEGTSAGGLGTSTSGQSHLSSTDDAGDTRVIERERLKDGKAVVGWRMPYDLPLVPYGKG